MLRNEHYKDDVIYITHVTRQILRLIGIWPIYNRKNTTREKIWKYFLTSICFILLCCVLVPGGCYWLIEKRTRIRFQTIPLLFFGIMNCGKYATMIFSKNNISRCLKQIEEDYKTVTSGEAREAMIESANVGRRLITICAIFIYTNGLSYRLILPFARGKIVTLQNVTIRPLPCPGYYIFFDVQVSPNYELIFILQIISGIVNYSISASVCGLAAVFVMHTCGQLKIMEILLKNLVEKQRQQKQEVDKKLAEIVEHHIRIRRFLKMVDNILQQACLIEVMGSTILLCFAEYFIIVEWENSNAMAMSSQFVTCGALLVIMFMYCYIGEQLMAQAENIARTSCGLEWYRLPDKKARGLVLVIIMSNMPTKVTAGKIMDLSFRTYGDIIKTSLTYFNMLINVTE